MSDERYDLTSPRHRRRSLTLGVWSQTFVPDVWVRPADAAEPESEFDFEQRWFCGSHSNIGGGYDFDYLPQFALHWVMQGAIREGLAFLQITPLTGADCCDCPVRHELNESTNVFGEALSKTDEVFAKFFGNVKVNMWSAYNERTLIACPRGSIGLGPSSDRR